MLAAAAAAEGEAVVYEHLERYLERNGEEATFEGWIAQLHPENVRVDDRLLLPASRHATLWKEQRRRAAAARGKESRAEFIACTGLKGRGRLWPCGPRALAEEPGTAVAPDTAEASYDPDEPGPSEAPQPRAVAPPEPREVVVTVLPGEARQRLLGFGGSMTEASAAVIMGSPRREQVLDDLFLPPAAGGAGVSVVRVPIGASDFALEPPGAYSYRDSEAAPFDASRDEALLVPCLQAAKRRCPHLTLIGSPWSAPGWMKSSGSLVGGSLRPAMLPQYCRYLLQAILFWQSHGLPLHAVTLQNEPFHGWAKYPCMTLDEGQQARLAALLSRLLRANGLATRVLGHDHNYSLVKRAEALLAAASPGDIDGTAWHAYQGRPADALHGAVASLPVYVTEQTAHTHRPREAEEKGTAAGSVAWAVRNVLVGPALLGAVCGLQWNLALDETCGPVLRGGPTNCRGLVEVPSGGGPHERSPEWYGVAHASAAVAAATEAAGCWRVASSRDCEAEKVTVLVTATAGGRWSVVAHNGGGAPVRLRIAFDQAPAEGAGEEEEGAEAPELTSPVWSWEEWQEWLRVEADGGRGEEEREGEAGSEREAAGEAGAGPGAAAVEAESRAEPAETAAAAAADPQAPAPAEAAAPDPPPDPEPPPAPDAPPEPATAAGGAGKEGGTASRVFELSPHAMLSASALAPPDGVVFTPPPLAPFPARPVRLARLPSAVLLVSVAHGTMLAAHGEQPELVFQSHIQPPATPGTWEVWRPREVAPRVFRLQSSHGTLLGVERIGRVLVQRPAANALAALEFTLFEFDDGTVGLCADLGNIHFPARRLLDGILDRDGGWPLPCLKQGAFGSWESFRAIPATM